MGEQYTRIEIRERVRIEPALGERICRVGDQWYRITHMSQCDLKEHFAEKWPEDFRIFGPAGWQVYNPIPNDERKESK